MKNKLFKNLWFEKKYIHQVEALFASQARTIDFKGLFSKNWIFKDYLSCHLKQKSFKKNMIKKTMIFAPKCAKTMKIIVCEIPIKRYGLMGWELHIQISRDSWSLSPQIALWIEIILTKGLFLLILTKGLFLLLSQDLRLGTLFLGWWSSERKKSIFFL